MANEEHSVRSGKFYDKFLTDERYIDEFFPEEEVQSCHFKPS
ncbi:hypothetical protein B4110_2534 [Parageobacillus toebii]|uniref:Uncharacterized protein n=1 Tax=Parageobacillus toebii TaxID=153151 RepID=A0A150MML4_9BACL|nr:hypothetical protein B4110_2534 [Parageobacillus toebii]